MTKSNKGKLSPTQEKIMNNIINADYVYKTVDDNMILNDYIYIDGVKKSYNPVSIDKDGKYSVKLNTRTLNALISKGYVKDPEEVRGVGFERIETVDTYEKPVPFKELEYVEVRYNIESNNFRQYKRLAFPVGQFDITIETLNYIPGSLEIVRRSVEAVEIF